MKTSKERMYHSDTEWLKEDYLQMPSDLNHESVASHLKMISRTNPQHLPATVQAIREKWAYMVGGWAERGRLEYVNTVLLQLKISDEILTLCVAMDEKWQAQQEKKRQRHAETTHGVPDLEAQSKAEELRARIAKAKADQAEAEKRKRDIENTPRPKREMSAEERRKQKLKEANEEIDRLEKRRNTVLQNHLRGRHFDELSVDEQEEYLADENMYNRRIREAKERRVQYE